MGLGPAHAAPWTQAYPAANSVPSQGTASTSEPPRKQMLQHLVHQPCCSQALKGAAETLILILILILILVLVLILILYVSKTEYTEFCVLLDKNTPTSVFPYTNT